MKSTNKAKISGLLHAKCSITADEIKTIAAKSIGQSEDYYAFEIKRVIETLRFYQKQITSYDNEIKIIMDECVTNIMIIQEI